MNEVVEFILMFGIVTTLLILLSLLNSKNKALTKFILTFFFTSILLVNISAYASLNNLRYLYILTFIFDFSIVWLIGPLLLLYIRSLFEPKEVVRKSLIHFTPVLFLLLFIGIPLVISFLFPAFDPPYLIYLDDNQSSVLIVRNLHCIGYLVFAMHEFKNYQAQLTHNYAHITKNDSDWIKRLLLLCLVFVALDLVLNLYELVWADLSFHTGFVIIVLIIFITIYLGYFGIKQSTMLLPEFLTLNSAVSSPTITKPTTVFTPDEKMTDLKKQFVQQLKEEKYYQEEDLNLQKLASYFELSDKQLSTLLNQYIGQSFYDYINRLRLEEVKEQLINPVNDQYTILAVAFASGFNSKATFNRIFKKETGMTPSSYRKLYHQNRSQRKN